MSVLITGVVDPDTQKSNYKKKLQPGQSVEGRLICCIECGNRFFVSKEQENWWISKGLCVPTHCAPCRRRRKHKQQAAFQD